MMLVSCVYPYNPDLVTRDGRMVIEGAITVGSTCEFKFSYVYGFNDPDDKALPTVTGYVEGEDGRKFTGYHPLQEVPTGTYRRFYQYNIDMFDASPNVRYRVHFEDADGNVYESDWIKVCDKPVIDDLRYILDHDRKELNVAISMHCPTETRFRWHYIETWEYHSILYATHYFNYQLMWDANGKYAPLNAWLPFKGDDNTYYCWKTNPSPEVKVISTSDQNENRFTDLEFHRVPSSDQKLSVFYNLRLYFEAIDENAYLYWKNIEENSDNQGGIFSPVPSQMHGNVYCVSNPDAEVIGYINASQVAIADVYYNNQVERFYDGTETSGALPDIIETEDPDDFMTLYSRGYRPYTHIPQVIGSEYGIFQWSWATCVDCRLLGGSKNRPADWPNPHW